MAMASCLLCYIRLFFHGRVWYTRLGSINLANVFVKSFFRFSDFLLEKGRIKLNPQQLWIFEKAI